MSLVPQKEQNALGSTCLPQPGQITLHGSADGSGCTTAFDAPQLVQKRASASIGAAQAAQRTPPFSSRCCSLVCSISSKVCAMALMSSEKGLSSPGTAAS